MDRREVVRDLGPGLVEDLARAEVDDVDGEEDPAELGRVDRDGDRLAGGELLPLLGA